jgi:porphobilinogen synthase
MHPLRPRRLRQTESWRNLIAETDLRVSDLIAPLFVREDLSKKEPIPSLTNHFQLTVHDLSEEIDRLLAAQISALLLFTIPSIKDPLAQSAYADKSITQQAINSIKKKAPKLMVIADCCLCSFTDHGHCGFLNEKGEIDNDLTLNLLQKTAVAQAEAGADCIAPSSMMDGQVHAIRQALDARGFKQIPILSYSAKYASSLYGPFRQAAACAPRFGNRRSYQMDPRNGREALKEVSLDLKEGADMVMVKPAHTYLDIIYRIKQRFPEVPLVAYHTSGEYALLQAAAEKEWASLPELILETHLAIKRAGADCIISYFSTEIAQLLSFN